MKVYEIGTGYTPIPANMGAATEIVAEELTKSMLKKGVDVSIIDIQAKDRLPNNLPIIEVPVPAKFTGTDVQLGLMHKLKRVVYSVSLAFKLKKILKAEKEKVILHFHNQYNMFFFLKLTGKKLREKCFLAYTNHSYIWHGEWAEIENTVNKRYFQENFSMKNADMVYVLNERTIDTLINHVGIEQSKIKLIDNGVNTEIYRPLDMSANSHFRAEKGVGDNRVYLQIGSVCDRKNQLGAIQLLLPLLKEDKKSCYVYAGGIISQEYQDRILEYSRQNGIESQIVYMGELRPGAELNKYYNLADVMVFPSKAEGFSLVIIEAMSAGVPVIINDNLQFKLSDECLKYKDGEAFLKCIKTNIFDNDCRHQLSEKCRKAVLENYSWDKIAVDYLNSWENRE